MSCWDVFTKHCPGDREKNKKTITMGNEQSRGTMQDREAGIEQILEVRDKEEIRLFLSRLAFHTIPFSHLSDPNIWPTQYKTSVPGYIMKPGYGACLIYAAREAYTPLPGTSRLHYAVRLVNPVEGYGNVTNTARYRDVPSAVVVTNQKMLLLIHLKMVITKFNYDKKDPDSSILDIATSEDGKYGGSGVVIKFGDFMQLVAEDTDGSEGYAYAWRAFKQDNEQAVANFGLDRRYTRVLGGSDIRRDFNSSDSTMRRSRAPPRYPPPSAPMQRRRFTNSSAQDDIDDYGQYPIQASIGSSIQELADKDYAYALAPKWYSPPPEDDEMRKFDMGMDYFKPHDGSGSGESLDTKTLLENESILRHKRALSMIGIGNKIVAHESATHATESMLSYLRK